MSYFSKTVSNSVRHWYLPLIAGILFIILGIYTFTYPLDSYLALSIFFSVAFLFSGLSEIIFSISNREELDNWGWTLTFGIFTFAIGLLLILNPGISMITLPLYVGFTVLFRSIMGLSFALELKNYGILEWGNLMIISFVGLILSIFLLWNPLFAGITIVFWTGMALIVGGIYNIYLSIKLKQLKNKL